MNTLKKVKTQHYRKYGVEWKLGTVSQKMELRVFNGSEKEKTLSSLLMVLFSGIWPSNPLVILQQVFSSHLQLTNTSSKVVKNHMVVMLLLMTNS